MTINQQISIIPKSWRQKTKGKNWKKYGRQISTQTFITTNFYFIDLKLCYLNWTKQISTPFFPLSLPLEYLSHVSPAEWFLNLSFWKKKLLSSFSAAAPKSFDCLRLLFYVLFEASVITNTFCFLYVPWQKRYSIQRTFNWISVFLFFVSLQNALK